MTDLQNILSFKDLSIGYLSSKGGKGRVVAAGLTTSLRSGSMACLIGANGIGKSTLLRTICGFLQPLKGELLLNEKPLSGYSKGELSRLVGIVLTRQTNLHQLTVREVVALGRTPYTGFFGKLSEHDNEVVEHSLSQVGMEDFAARPVDELSDGERQKVMIAKALAQETPILLLDEPTAFLDFTSKVDMLLLLRELAHKGGKIVMISTHDIELALQLTDEIWLMSDRGLSCGTVDELTDNEALSEFIDKEGIVYNKITKKIEIKNGL